MIDLAGAYKEIETNSQKFSILNFNCEYCNQTFNLFSFNVSIFLYGVAFLAGKDLCYAGITCPKCLNTILMKGDSLTRLQQDLHSDLRYCFSIINPHKQVEYLESFQIRDTEHFFSDGISENFYNMLTESLEEKPKLERDYVCSYIKNSNLPIGYAVSVWWFKPDDIEKLVQIENEHKMRVLPRYVHKMSWYEQYDTFCWQYKLKQDYFFKKLKKDASDTYNALSEYARQKNINLDNLLGANNTEIISENYVEHTSEGLIKILEHQHQESLDKDTSVTSIFLDLIVNFDPAPWDSEITMSNFYKDLWKSLTPFRGTSVPIRIEEFDPKKYIPRMSDAEVEEIAEKVRPLITKSHIQDWAMDNHQKFIEEYISLTRRSDFSYGCVWDLKCHYLQQLHSILKNALVEEARYAFVSEEIAWRITFDGKTISGLRGGGLRYLHYLVANKGKKINTFFLGSLDGDSKGIIADRTFEDNDPYNKKAKKENVPTVDVNEGADPRLKEFYEAKMKEYELEMKEYEIEMEDAKKMGDDQMYKEAKTKYEDIKTKHKEIKRNYNIDFFGGKSRKDDDGTMKSRRAIVKAISRAIEEIGGEKTAGWNRFRESVASHFTIALGKIGLYENSYTPKEDIDWILE